MSLNVSASKAEPNILGPSNEFYLKIYETSVTTVVEFHSVAGEVQYIFTLK